MGEIARKILYPRAEVDRGVCSFTALLICLWVLCIPSSSLARGNNAALAEELFQQAKLLMDEGEYSSACLKFKESQRLDPATGTLLNLANCHEKTGELASAWSEYTDAAAMAARKQREDRVEYAQARLREIKGSLSKLVILLPPKHDIEGLKIVLNESEVGRAAWGIALPVDPGESTIRLSAKGRQTLVRRFTVEPGPSQIEFQVPLLSRLVSHQATAGTDKQEPQGDPWRVAALVTGGVGVVGIGVGSVFGVLALTKNKESNEKGCDNDYCDGVGEALRDQARGYGDIATILLSAGGVLLAGGVVLYLSSRDGTSTEARAALEIEFSPSGGTMGFRGVF